jgi:uncharacterized membrane protein
MTSTVNVVDVERWASAVGGALLIVDGLRNQAAQGARSIRRRGCRGRRGADVSRRDRSLRRVCGDGISTAGDETRARLAGSRGVNVEEVTTINASPAELYVFWRKLESLPRFMKHLLSVTQLDPRRSHWVAKGPAGRKIEWDAKIVNEIPGELIAWRTLPGSELVSAGSVQFKRASGGRGAEVRVRLQYDPPAGKLGATVAWLLKPHGEKVH